MVDRSFLKDLDGQIEAKQKEINENQKELLQLQILKQYWKGYCDGQEALNGNQQQ